MNKITTALLFLWFVAVLSLYGVNVEYAEGFSIEERAGYTLLHVHPPSERESNTVTYVLVPRESTKIPAVSALTQSLELDSNPQIIKTPIQSLIPLSTTFLPPLLWFDAEETLKAVDKLEHIYSPALRSLVKRKKIPQVGNGPTLDLEMVVQFQPAPVMANVTQGTWNVVPKLRQAAVPVILNADYLETTPLGRAEWIKFIGLLLGQAEAAEHRFNEVEQRYKELVRIVDEYQPPEQKRPQVILNRPMNGRWVVPGGRGYMARFIEDAGGVYLWKDAQQSASLVLDVEEVFLRALQADFWLHQYDRSSLEEIASADQRLKRIKAFREGNVANNDARVNAVGSNDFFESGPYQPHIILADLISLFYPALLPNHSLHYYRYLE
jgi:iron complex transport system substrate-binding protein